MSVPPELVLLALLGLVAYTVRGITGAGSAIVFNALFGVALALGLTGGLTLLDGLYWIALAESVTSLVMFAWFRSDLLIERFTLRVLLLLVPLTILATLVLPRVEVAVLALGLGLVLVLSGAYLAMRRTLERWDDATLERRSLPFGAAAGVVNGLYGMAGSVVLVFLAHAGPETDVYRMRALLITGVSSIVRGAVVLLTGVVGAEGLVRFGLTIPFMLLGLAIGIGLHPRVGERAFRVGLGAIVAVAGILLVARAITA